MNWTVLGGVKVPVPDKPWSGVVATPRHGATTLLFETDVAPVRVYLQVFVALDAETGLPFDPETGETVRFGKIYIDCSTYSEPCLEADGDFWKWEAFPEEMFEHEYVTVGAQWLLQGDSSGRKSGTVRGGWQFHFVNE